MGIVSEIKSGLALNVKNIKGWKTKRKLVIFSVDDYGNVRVDSKQARENMTREGLKIYDRFDALDTLETPEDLEQLYETLTSVRDSKGNHAVFTPFAIPANINFEKMAEENYKQYHYELLPETFAKLPGYERAWDLWKEGLSKHLMVPQFHGREHFNVRVFQEALDKKDKETLTALKNRSYTSISSTGYSTISSTAAFEFWKESENENFNSVIEDGLNVFEKVFGYRAEHFNAPGAPEHPAIHRALKENGIKYLDTPLIRNQHQGEGQYKRIVNYTGKRNELGMLYLVRNVVFEPTDDRGFDWHDYTIKQIEAAFRWNKPAIISSHRINFCGHIDPENRRNGLSVLRNLLTTIVKKWPEVEFMSANELGNVIEEN